MEKIVRYLGGNTSKVSDRKVKILLEILGEVLEIFGNLIEIEYKGHIEVF